MNKQSIYLPFVVLITAVAACTPPEKDIPGLSSEIDAVAAGHYGQSIHHAELAEEKREEANNVLKHWQNDHYWNIDERQKAMDAAREAARHRLASEKELCQWLTSAHGPNHLQSETAQHTAAYFKTGSATPYKINDHDITILGKYLQSHPDAIADVIAYTDTVGSSRSNQNLSERRAASVTQMLIDKGAKAEQLRVTSLGEAEGPDNTPNQHHRIVALSTVHPNYVDCPNLK